MAEWFRDLGAKDDPGRDDLLLFVDEVIRFLDFVVLDESTARLWSRDPELQELAGLVLQQEVRPAAARLKAALREIDLDALKAHGLVGLAAKFKYSVMARVAHRWRGIGKQFSVGRGFRRIVEAIDAHLDSVISAAAGAGGLIKEFKDAVLALAPEA